MRSLRILVSARKQAAVGRSRTSAEGQGYDITAAIEVATLVTRKLIYIFHRCNTPLPTHSLYCQQLPVGTKVPDGYRPLQSSRDFELDRYRIYKVVFQEFQAQQTRDALDTVDPGVVTAAAFRAEPEVSENAWESHMRRGGISRDSDAECFRTETEAKGSRGTPSPSRSRLVRASVRRKPSTGNAQCCV